MKPFEESTKDDELIPFLQSVGGDVCLLVIEHGKIVVLDLHFACGMLVNYTKRDFAQTS